MENKNVRSENRLRNHNIMHSLWFLFNVGIIWYTYYYDIATCQGWFCGVNSIFIVISLIILNISWFGFFKLLADARKKLIGKKILLLRVLLLLSVTLLFISPLIYWFYIVLVS